MAINKGDYLVGLQRLSMTGVEKKDLNTPIQKMKTFSVNNIGSSSPPIEKFEVEGKFLIFLNIRKSSISDVPKFVEF